MWRAFWFLIVVTALGAGAAWVADRPGVVVLDWGSYRIETSAAVMAAGVAVFAVVVALTYRVWLFFRRAPGNIRFAWRQRRRNKGLQALTKGMVAVAAGDPDEARKQSRRAESLLNDPPLTMLLSAQAAQLAGDDRAAERFFRAMTDNRETEFLGLRGLLNQAIKRGDRDEALILARRAYRLKPDSEWVSTSLFELQTQSGQWIEAQSTAKEAVRHRHLPAPEGRRRDAVLACQQAIDAENAGDREAAIRQARTALDNDGKLIPAAAVLARCLLSDGKNRKAAAAIERIWPKAPHADLVELYWRAKGADDALARVKASERLAGFNPGHLESRLARAVAALEADLWGEARKHFGRLIEDEDIETTSLVYRLMARLEEAEHGDLETARSWLVQAATSDPDPAWVCDTCGNVAAAWSAVCERCGSFDSLAWQSPPHTSRPAEPEALLVAAESEEPPRAFIADGRRGEDKEAGSKRDGGDAGSALATRDETAPAAR